MRRLLRGIPDQRPVHRQLFAVGLHRRHHRIRFRQTPGKGLLHQHMRAERRHLLHPLPVAGRRWTQHHQIRLRLVQTGPMIREHLRIRQLKIFARALHPLRLLVRDPHDLCIRMLERLPQQITHVKVIKVDPRNAPLFHVFSALSFVLSHHQPRSQVNHWRAPCSEKAKKRSPSPLEERAVGE